MERNVNDYKIIKRFREKELIAQIQKMEDGSITALLTGGDVSHVGAVYIRDNKGTIIKHAFEGHKDYVLAEEWLKAFGKITTAPIVISVGIHYDNISFEDIKKIEKISCEMLEDGCLFIKSKGGILDEKIN